MAGALRGRSAEWNPGFDNPFLIVGRYSIGEAFEAVQPSGVVDFEADDSGLVFETDVLTSQGSFGDLGGCLSRLCN